MDDDIDKLIKTLPPEAIRRILQRNAAKGGHKSAKSMTRAERVRRAKAGAKARWSKKPKPEKGAR